MPEHDAEQHGDEVDGEDVVRVQEEADPGHEDRPHVVQPEGDLVDLGQGEPPPQVRVLDVAEVVEEVVEGAVAAVGSLVGDRSHRLG